MFVKNYTSVLYHIMRIFHLVHVFRIRTRRVTPRPPTAPTWAARRARPPQTRARLDPWTAEITSAGRHELERPPPPWTVTERVIQRPRPIPTHRRGQVCICVCCAHVLRFCETSGGCCYCYTLVNCRAPYKAVTVDLIFLRLWWVGDTDHWVSFAHHLPPPIRTGSEKL